MRNPGDIPEQIIIPWRTTFVISWRGLKRRFLRSLITMVGVILAIAFLAYMLTTGHILDSLVAHADGDLQQRLQENGVDIHRSGTDSMTVLLIGLSLLTCMAGIINSMLMSVTERIREIGTLKCLGARDQFIVRTYLIESTLQGICGSMLGMVLGWLVGVIVLLADYGGYVFEHFPVLDVLAGLGISLLAGSVISVIAAIAPAYLAARKQPVEALRVEE